MPEFSKVYFHYSRKAFNMAKFLVAEFHWDDSVFVAALTYWHKFVYVHGLQAIHEIVLVAACVFLAAKVAHYKFQTKKLVALAFDLDPPTNGDDEAAPWKASLLDAELVLCDTLQFNFHVVNPSSEMERFVFSHSPSQKLSNVEMALVEDVVDRIKRVMIFLLISPVMARVTSEELYISLLHVIRECEGPSWPHAVVVVWDDLLLSHAPPAAEVARSVKSVLVDTFFFVSKTSGFSSIDSLVEERKRLSSSRS